MGDSVEKGKIREFAKDYLAKENAKLSNKSIDYLLFEGDDQLELDDGFSEGYDGRLDKEGYRENSFTVMARSRKDMSVIARTTLFVTGYDVYKDVFFWQANEDRTVLSKVGLDTYKDLVGDWCITIGFTQIADNIRFSPDMLFKYKSVFAFYNFAKQIVADPRNFVHLEPGGPYLMPDEVLACDSLLMEECNIDVDTLGDVHEDSWVAHKVAERFKMHKMNNLYHDETLGPVFFSKVK